MGEIDAGLYKKECVRNIQDLPYQSEDCLYLDIWQPLDASPQNTHWTVVYFCDGYLSLYGVAGNQAIPKLGHYCTKTLLNKDSILLRHYYARTCIHSDISIFTLQNQNFTTVGHYYTRKLLHLDITASSH